MVEIANHGLEALELLHDKPMETYDLVLMDMEMPEMDGFTATRSLRKEECFKSLPIVAMTALAMKGDRERCLAAGMDDYISKPISPQSLFTTISHVCESHGISTGSK